MRVWWAILLLAGASLALPGAAAEPECETIGVIERCAYDDERVKDHRVCHDGWSRGCWTHNETVDGTRYEVGGAWVFVGERDVRSSEWREFTAACPERMEQDHHGRTSFIHAGSGSTRAGVESAEDEHTLDGRRDCADGTTEQNQRWTSREHRIWFDSDHVDVGFRVEEWSYERRFTNDTRNETQSKCGTGVGVAVSVTMVPTLSQGRTLDHCRD